MTTTIAADQVFGAEVARAYTGNLLNLIVAVNTKTQRKQSLSAADVRLACQRKETAARDRRRLDYLTASLTKKTKGRVCKK